VREQLIAAIENDPNDVENYRVYADWLEANNQPRGQLITMELLRERLTDRSKREHLNRRIAEYFQRHRSTFVGALKSWPEIRYETQYGPLKWRYGFIQIAQVGRWDADGSALQQLHELLASPSGRFLVGLELHGVPALLPALLEHVPASLRNLEICIDGLDLSAAWPQLSRLGHLGINASDVVLGTIDLPNLETATINGNYVRAFCDAHVLKLATLRIDYGHDPLAIIKLLDTLDAPVLAGLELLRTRQMNEIVGELPTTKLGRQLARVDLRGSELTDAGARRWAKARPTKRLRQLIAIDTHITKAGIQILRDAVADEVVVDAQDGT